MKVAIIGASISGLFSAYLLAKKGIEGVGVRSTRAVAQTADLKI